MREILSLLTLKKKISNRNLVCNKLRVSKYNKDGSTIYLNMNTLKLNIIVYSTIFLFLGPSHLKRKVGY